MKPFTFLKLLLIYMRKSKNKNIFKYFKNIILLILFYYNDVLTAFVFKCYNFKPFSLYILLITVS